MNIRDYWNSLNADERIEYAQRAGTSPGYIKVHLIPIPPTRTPRPTLYKKLMAESYGEITREEMFRHFYGV